MTCIRIIRGLAIVLPALFLAIGCNSSASAQDTNAQARRLYRDHELFTRGPYTAFMDSFNKKSYVDGKDFTQSFTVDPLAFPRLTQLRWNWPLRDPKYILAFLQVAGFGDYFNTVPERPVAAKRVKDIKKLVVSHDLTHSGTPNGYDIIYDYFLTEKPNGGTSHLFEVELFLHTPAYSARYVSRTTPIGSFSDAGVVWTVAIDKTTKPPDILFMPTNQAGLPVATIDLNAMHNYLIAKGILTGEEYYNGHSLGVEPAQGDGSLYVNDAFVEFE